MKKLALLTTLAAFLCLPMPICAQDTQSDAPTEQTERKSKKGKKSRKGKNSKKGKKDNVVAKSIKKFKPILGKVSEYADYVLVCSIDIEDKATAALLDSLKDEADNLKEDKVSVLLLCKGGSKKKVTKYMREQEARFATILMDDEDIEDIKKALPDYDESKQVTIYSEKAEVVASGDSTLISERSKVVAALEDQKTWETFEVDPKENAVAAALRKFPTVHGPLNPKADYYIYLYSASWCGPCKMLMPKIVEMYKKDLMYDSRVALILLGADSNDEGVRQYISHYDMPIYAICYKTPGVNQIPGFQQPPGIPFHVIVDKKGNVVTSGLGGAILNWKSHVKL